MMSVTVLLAVLARGPWPALLPVSLAGWIALLAFPPSLTLASYCAALPGSRLALGWQDIELAILFNPPAELIIACLMMLLAMMPPLLAEPARHVWCRTLARRRVRAIALFVAGYVAVWLPVALILMAAAIGLRAFVDPGWQTTAIAIAVGVVWQAAPAKQRCLNRCHYLPRLSAFGMAADRDCLRYGLTTGLWCAGACWALMFIPLAVDDPRLHVVLMLAAAAIMLAERQATPRPARWRFRFAHSLLARAAVLARDAGGAALTSARNPSALRP